MALEPFRIHIPDSELELLSRKLEIARLPTNLANEQWAEDNGVTLGMIKGTLDFWRKNYNWREEEVKLNELPQYKCPIDVEGFGTLDIHFVHSESPSTNAQPLLFVHGWPGSFVEVSKILPLLNNAGFHVVAPSLPGYGFSSDPGKAGFKYDQDAEVMHKVMLRLGYDKYFVQGGDWGSDIVRACGRRYAKNVQAVHINHVNLVTMPKPDFDTEPEYTEFEKRSIRQQEHFATEEFAYYMVQNSKSRTLGFAMHDSPIGMLAWMADKLFTWSDHYPWSPTELITWTLLHYFPGPTTGFRIYREHGPGAQDIIPYESTPTGVSAFSGEMEMVPRCWTEKTANIKFWREHESGGHFAAYEKPKELASDLIDFFHGNYN